MKLDLKNLPSDPKLLHQIISDLSSEVISLSTENSSLKEKLTSLKNQLALLKAKRFGKSSEKLDKEIADLELKIEEEEEKNCNKVIDEDLEDSDSDSDSNKKTAKNKPKRQPLPDHLPREDKILNPDPTCKECGGDDFHKISDDITETLNYIPSSFKVTRTIRPRCSCRNCEHIMQADIPERYKTTTTMTASRQL